jgi:hypothetical protein
MVQNLGWNDGVNYALNVSGYSIFGGVQINGQDTDYIYKRVGDLTIASPSLSSIILKTNYGAWEAMRLNTTGISINTSLYISWTTILNNTSCLSSFNVSGTTPLNGNKLNFPNILNQFKINLWGTNNYGFGVADSTLQYSSQVTHKFHNSANNANTLTMDSTGSVIKVNNIWHKSADGILTMEQMTFYITVAVGTQQIGVANIRGTSPSAVPNNYMSSGSLTIGREI